MKNLVKRGLQMDDMCPRCGEEKEDVLHLLVRCAEAKTTWYLSPLRIDCNEFKADSLWESICSLLGR